MTALSVANLVSHRTREGIVQLLQDDQPIAQMSPDEARSFASQIQECAAVAECEAHLIAFLTARVEVPMEYAIQVLKEFREQRGRG
jgi:hypothetical protein